MTFDDLTYRKLWLFLLPIGPNIQNKSRPKGGFFLFTPTFIIGNLRLFTDQKPAAIDENIVRAVDVGQFN